MDTKIRLRKAGLLLAYPVAYLYLRLVFGHVIYMVDKTEWWVAPANLIFAVIFIAWNEIVRRSKKDEVKKESYFWYLIMVMTAGTTAVAPSPILSCFAMHLCAVYSVAVSNGTLYEGRTGRFIAKDLLNTGLLKTFPKMDKLISDAKIVKEKASSDRTSDRGGYVASVVMIIAVVPVLILVLFLLSSLNYEFKRLIMVIIGYLDIAHLLDQAGPVIMRLIFAVPVSLFLYAMVSSCADGDGTAEKKAYIQSLAVSETLRKVAPYVAGTIVAVFDLIYLMFFTLEGKYLFGGLSGDLPAGYSFSSYARKGFFELIAIMSINLLLYLAVRKFCKRDNDGYTKGYVKYALSVLLLQSALFSILSFTKIFMYFNEYGYTPKRMLSMWGALILGAGAVFLTGTLSCKKDMSRIWIIFTSVSYIVICLLSGVLDFLF